MKRLAYSLFCIGCASIPCILILWLPYVAEMTERTGLPEWAWIAIPLIFSCILLGTGGWDTDFPNSMLEILRVVYANADSDHRTVVGGVEQVPNAIWRLSPDGMVHWPKGTSMAALHGGTPRGAVTKIRRAADGRIAITDRWSNTQSYCSAIVTCQSWLLSTMIDCDEGLFSQKMWMAMERTHYMQASKTFIIVDRPFWKDIDPATGQDVMSMTLSDRKTRGTYLLDMGDDQPAAICLSYTWNDDAMKWITLPVDQRVDLMIDSLKKIYPGLDLKSHIIADPITVSWEHDPYFMGAFKANLPGHYRYQRRLYSHFMQGDMPPAHRGIFLAGDSISWTAGWAEGAVTTALNAVFQSGSTNTTVRLEPVNGVTRTVNVERKAELVIFLTPTIIAGAPPAPR